MGKPVDVSAPLRYAPVEITIPPMPGVKAFEIRLAHVRLGEHGTPVQSTATLLG